MEQIKTRTVDEIRAEYSQMCAKAGHLQYSIHTLQKDLALVNEALLNLNFEVSKLPKEEPKKEEANV